MAVTYRSKDEEYMKRLKKSVFQGMKDMTLEDKRAAWKLVQRKVFMDDLHKVAIDRLDAQQPVYLGTGHLVPEVLVLTSKSLEFSKEAKDLVESIVKAARFDNVYYTGKYKCAKILKSQVDAYGDILEMEIKIVKPKVILCFGPVIDANMHEVTEFNGIPAIVTHALSDVLNEEDDEVKAKIKATIWEDVKKIRKLL